MKSTISLINSKLQNAPQEVLDRLLGYLDAIINETDDSIPQWQQDLVLKRKQTKQEDYLSLDSLEKDIKLQK